METGFSLECICIPKDLTCLELAERIHQEGLTLTLPNLMLMSEPKFHYKDIGFVSGEHVLFQRYYTDDIAKDLARVKADMDVIIFRGVEMRRYEIRQGAVEVFTPKITWESQGVRV